MENPTATEKSISKENLLKLISNNDSSVTFQKPKQKDNMSKVWTYFSTIHFQKMKQDYVICDSCQSLISCKAQIGTGGMQKHIECCRKISNTLDEHNECTITKYFHSTKIKSNYVPLKLKNKITNSLVEFIILDGRPFEIVRGSGFINLIECVLGVGLTLLESSTVSASDLIADPITLSRHIDRIYDERKCQLISLFQTIKSFVITVDFWKEHFTGNFLLVHASSVFHVQIVNANIVL
ncbi:unnamed protein product [Rotaria sp. Silwood2]|nr:unnamed protein product [Rotaria sp. Silwood2]